MSIELPGTVVDVLYFIGLPWPGIDEDELRGWATDLREFASEITDISRLTHDAVSGLKDSNESAFVKTVAQHWDHHHEQIMAMRGPMHAFADALDVAAGAVEVQKGAVITAAGALALAVAATQGEALFTLGIAEAEVPAEVAIAKMAIKFALQELEMQLLSTLIDKAGKEISDHASRSIANLLKGGAGVAFEAVSLKVDYQGLERVAQVARAHASRAETASMRAHRKANARKLETHSAGGKWHVVAVLEAALKSIAEDIFRRLPGALHTVLLDTEKDLEKDIAALKEADARAAEAARSTPHAAEAAPGVLALGAGGGKPPIEPPERPTGFAEEPPPEDDPTAGAGQQTEPVNSDHGAGQPLRELESGLPGGPTYKDLLNWKSRRTQQRAAAYPGEKRWHAGERHVANMWGGRHQGNHVPVPTHDNAPYPVTGPGGRDVDVVHVGLDGRRYHIEVKTYQRWKTVNGVSVEQFVPLSEDIREQIAKDVNIRAADPSVELRWHFADAHPSPELRNALLHARIVFTTMN